MGWHVRIFRSSRDANLCWYDSLPVFSDLCCIGFSELEEHARTMRAFVFEEVGVGHS
jgi:hypothetical protein